MARMTRAMATATKRAMATNGENTGNGYRCLWSSAAAVAAVRMDDKGSGSLFLYGVVIKKWFVCFLNFDVWQGGCLSGRPFCSRRILRVGFLF
jgi:hypothetical protein